MNTRMAKKKCRLLRIQGDKLLATLVCLQLLVNFLAISTALGMADD